MPIACATASHISLAISLVCFSDIFTANAQNPHNTTFGFKMDFGFRTGMP